MEQKLLKRIVINPRILNGKPIIKGTRISVEFILELLASGMTQDGIIKEYKHLKKKRCICSFGICSKHN